MPARFRQLGDRHVGIQEGVVGLQRRLEEEMLVRVAGPEIGRRNVPSDRPDDLGVSSSRLRQLEPDTTSGRTPSGLRRNSTATIKRIEEVPSIQKMKISEFEA